MCESGSRGRGEEDEGDGEESDKKKKTHIQRSQQSIHTDMEVVVFFLPASVH